MHRIFADESSVVKDNFIIPIDSRFHLGRVVKLREGEEFEAVVKDKLYKLEYVDFENAKIVSISEIEIKSTKISLYFGILKGEKNDLVLQKCTELGVTDFYPVMTKRTISMVKGKEESKMKRWQKITDEASKQSKAIQPSIVHSPIMFSDTLESLKLDSLVIVPYELEKSINLKSSLKEYKGGDISIFIGPEGGFDESEIQELLQLGSKVVTLGTKILRAETACISTVSNVVYELELYNE